MFDKLPISSKTEKILTKSLDEPISAEDANYLINIKGSDLYPLLATADYLRQEIAGKTGRHRHRRCRHRGPAGAGGLRPPARIGPAAVHAGGFRRPLSKAPAGARTWRAGQRGGPGVSAVRRTACCSDPGRGHRPPAFRCLQNPWVRKAAAKGLNAPARRAWRRRSERRPRLRRWPERA